MADLLFVYGTLMPDRAPGEVAGVVGRLRPVGEAILRGRLYDLGEYPGAILDNSCDSTITGQLFTLPAEPGALDALDDYEGFDNENPRESLFVRERATATLPDGRRVRCWVYVYNREVKSAPLITGGDYTKHRAA